MCSSVCRLGLSRGFWSGSLRNWALLSSTGLEIRVNWAPVFVWAPPNCSGFLKLSLYHNIFANLRLCRLNEYGVSRCRTWELVGRRSSWGTPHGSGCWMWVYTWNYVNTGTCKLEGSVQIRASKIDNWINRVSRFECIRSSNDRDKSAKQILVWVSALITGESVEWLMVMIRCVWILGFVSFSMHWPVVCLFKNL